MEQKREHCTDVWLSVLVWQLDLAGIGAGVGEQGIGAAVVGVVAEEPGFLGKGLFLMLLPETLIIFGLAVSLILMFAWTPFADLITGQFEGERGNGTRRSG